MNRAALLFMSMYSHLTHIVPYGIMVHVPYETRYRDGDIWFIVCSIVLH